MRLTNETGAAAYLYKVNLLEPDLRVVAIVKKTYALDPDGLLAAAEEPLPLIVDQLVTEHGCFHGEIFFRKRGIDICVLGTARFETPVRHARVRIDVGPWNHELKLIGDRVWTRDHSGTLVPTAPAPFQEMPISYARAFGGVAQVNGEDVPLPDNPLGRGYYESAEDAIGKPLPNIEPANWSAACRWNTRIPVAGWAPYPMYWGLRASRAVKVEPKSGEILDVSTELFNHAHPDLILDRLEPGTPVRVTGLRKAPIVLVVPRERPRVECHVGEKVSEAFGEIDGLFLWTEATRVVVTWRARFRYAFRPEEIRRATLSFVQ